MENPIEIKGAEISGCYRYKLWRIWNENENDNDKPVVMCIGLNPSKADCKEDDTTIRILRGVLTKLGYGGFYMVNLFALISSKPSDLLICSDPMGDNESKLKEVGIICKNDVIVCWGSFNQAKERGKKLLNDYPNAKCFGKNKDKDSSPIHPRRLRFNGMENNPKLIPYNDKC